LLSPSRRKRPFLNLELHELNFEGPSSQIQARHTNWQLESAWSRTSRIDVQNAIAFEFYRLVRMAADDDVESRCRRIQVERMHIVQDVKPDLARIGNRSFRQRASPFAGIYVSAHRDDGRKFSEGGENFRMAHVATVEDQLRTAEGFPSLRAQQAVGV
jgi:hypothetical protein